MTLVFSLDQMRQVNRQLNAVFINDLVLYLEQQCGALVRGFPAEQFRVACANFVLACTDLTAESRFDVFRLAEMALSFQSKLQLEALPAGWLDCLQDERFSFAERVDVITLRLAFPLANPLHGDA